MRSVGLTLVVAGVCAGFSGPAAQAQAVPPELARVRTALEKYRDPIVAIREGYFSSLGCVAIAQAGAKGHVPYRPGAMGIHFLNTALVGPVPDLDHPPVLVYEPHGGKLHLVAAEWFVPLATGVKERPQLLGHPFDGPMEGHYPLMPHAMTHYDLHVWLFKANPYGLFSPTNPDVKCRGYSYESVEEAPKLVSTEKP